MPDIDTEIAALEHMRSGLEAHHMGEWVVVKNEELVGTFNAFEAAADFAVVTFGRGPYLIQQVGSPPLVLPASVMYNLRHA